MNKKVSTTLRRLAASLAQYFDLSADVVYRELKRAWNLIPRNQRQIKDIHK